MASVNGSDSFTSTVLKSSILPISSAVLVSPGHVLIGNWRVRFILNLLGQISVRCIVEELLLLEREAPSWKTNSHGKLLVSINSTKELCFQAMSENI